MPEYMVDSSGDVELYCCTSWNSHACVLQCPLKVSAPFWLFLPLSLHITVLAELVYRPSY